MCATAMISCPPRIEAIDRIVESAITQRIFPGAVVLIGSGATIEHHAAYGATTYGEPPGRPVEITTIYDIASLTKMVTATAVLRLWEDGQLDLDAYVARYIPELRAKTVTLRHLLTHTSGLDLRLSEVARSTRGVLWPAIYEAPLRQAPGTVAAYTNINSLLLGAILERHTGAPLDHALADLVLTPLQMADTCFCPAERLVERIAPSEYDQHWRGLLIHAHVHDESAYALGGVAGHAGLFSTAHDLYRLCLGWLPETGFLQPNTIKLATANQTAGLNLACGLGWMVERPNFMGTSPQGIVGHTGFTGPAMLITPEQTIITVVSNRTFPQRGAALHHAITAAITEATRRVQL
jgi:CubicO group peptidase (beta-lactamase class C family)